MKILSYNIQTEGQGREAEIAAVLRQHRADVVVLQEAYSPLQVQRIAHLANYIFFTAQFGYSLACLTIKPIDFDWLIHPHLRTPALVMKTRSWTIIGLHLRAGFMDRRERQREQEIETLLTLTQPYQEKKHLFVGDFNAIAPNDLPEIKQMPAYIRLLIQINGGLPQFALKRLSDAGYLDMFRFRYAMQKGYTLPAANPNARLDYAFLPQKLQLYIRDCYPVTSPPAVLTASDHLPLWIELGD